MVSSTNFGTYVFPFVYHFNSRIGVLVRSSFANECLSVQLPFQVTVQIPVQLLLEVEANLLDQNMNELEFELSTGCFISKWTL